MNPFFAALARSIVLSLALAGCATGDPDRGAKLHDACLQCHGTELYVPPAAKIKSYKALVDETRHWAGYYNPKFRTQEVEDIVAYLNRDFYKLPR